jgi:hypothetical protein
MEARTFRDADTFSVGPFELSRRTKASLKAELFLAFRLKSGSYVVTRLLARRSTRAIFTVVLTHDGTEVLRSPLRIQSISIAFQRKRSHGSTQALAIPTSVASACIVETVCMIFLVSGDLLATLGEQIPLLDDATRCLGPISSLLISVTRTVILWHVWIGTAL